MRILHAVHNHPGFHAGGTELFAQALSQALNQVPGLESRYLGVALPQHRKPNPGTAFTADPDGGGDLVMAGGQFNVLLMCQVDGQGFLHDWAALLKAWQPDVVHFHHLLLLGAEAPMVARRVLPKARLVMTLHDYYPLCAQDGMMVTKAGALCDKAEVNRCARCFPEAGVVGMRLRDLHVREALARMDALVAPSRFLAGRYHDWGIDAARLHHIPNALPPPARDGTGGTEPASADAPAGRPLRFGFFGHLNAAKGVNVLLRAALLLRQRGIDGFRISLHGDDRFAAETVTAETARLLDALGPLVSRHGPYRREAVPGLMRAADWVVMPSTWWENDPLVLEEAFAERRPVLCSGIGGMAERVTHGVNGLHARPGDAADLADQMQRALAEPGLGPLLGAQAPAPRGMADCVAAYLRLYRPPAAVAAPFPVAATTTVSLPIG